jgi:hypothetical protein
MFEAMLSHFRSQGAKSVRTLIDEQAEEILEFFRALGFEPSNLRPFARPL